MRLLNTTTLQLEEYIGSDVPEYAILSHTWGDQEVSFQEWLGREDISLNIQQKSGYVKIENFCRVAHRDGHLYAWVDTCCINKTSSAELTESINSMFQWYQKAVVCYAYLADFGPRNLSFWKGAKGCRWFTRGWTLQELIAPKVLRFYDGSWEYRGARDEHSRDLESITGIAYSVLLGPHDLEHVSPRDYSVADRMSWAASRTTKRMEDIAYCLLGIFEVNMPLIYGEGMGAFRRLQEAIIRNSNDLSILAWGMPRISEEKRRESWLESSESGYFTDSREMEEEDESAWSDMVDTDQDPNSASTMVPPPYSVRKWREDPPPGYRNLFASSPSDFIHSRDIDKPLHHYHNLEFTMTNKGLRMKTRVYKGQYEGSRGYFLYLGEKSLVNGLVDHAETMPIWLRLRKIWTDTFVPEALIERPDEADIGGHTGLMTFYISHRPHEDDTLQHPSDDIHIPEYHFIRLKKTMPESHWDETSRIFFRPDESNPLVFAAWFEAQISLDTKVEFVLLFDQTIACTEDHPFLCRLLDRREYPRQFDWIFSDRGPSNNLLWCDLEFNMLEIMQCGDNLQVDTGEGETFELHAELDKRREWTVQFEVTPLQMQEDD